MRRSALKTWQRVQHTEVVLLYLLCHEIPGRRQVRSQSDALCQLAWPIRALYLASNETARLCNFNGFIWSRGMQSLSSWGGSPYVKQETGETVGLH